MKPGLHAPQARNLAQVTEKEILSERSNQNPIQKDSTQDWTKMTMDRQKNLTPQK